ncbi:TetR/AcrR family transcriptional regulator [Rossellomorea aquimaris]|uniref:TetR/AcrR family transcriptional regulator n=1 Tax=Rossellomorea aquimaris TaxID=189382 RepID=UPI001CD70A5B|nr:TetR/AcrR family transcriptional regulator [Rossellomorea aquimaris]MCA1055442.1 TetR/AcrR family transcriptional regulator [Rossellomorea aquimaris]
MPASLSVHEKKKRKRTAILQAAVKLFSENGFAETPVAAIAKEAGVSFGTVFTYFETKEVLFHATILEPLEEIKPYFYDIEERYSGSPLEKVKGMILCQVELFSKRKEYLRLIQQVLARPDRYPDLFKELDDFVNVFIDRLAPIIIKGQEEGVFYKGSPALIAQSYLSLINGMRLTFIDEYTNLFWMDMKIQALRLFGPAHNEWEES